MLYRLAVPETGLISLNLSDMESGADVDVHLLSANDPDECISRGHWLAGGYVDRGYYWVVADTWSGASKAGSYTLDVGFVSVSDLEDWGDGHDVPADDALYAMGVAFEFGDPDRLYYAITDFSLHSGTERIWIVDLLEGSLLWNLHVTHGEGSSGSSDAYATTFSNINDSHQSSLGMMKGAEIYWGSFDKSMRIDGMESTYNGLVRSRAIVMHGADYARPEFVDTYGRAGQSWGCPALDDRLVGDVVEYLSDGSMMFFWYPDGDWSSASAYLD